MNQECKGTLSIRLANGKELETTSGLELACFYESGGSSIVPPSKKKKGGKSKGARNKGKGKARHTREERGD